ncbi:MAG: lipopolysaccharide assembly protein LapA domain-containing protein [Thermodesulfovibrionales bacterium]
MMPILLVLLVIVFFVSVFSVQNAIPVTISFFIWKFEASLAIVIFLSTVMGLIIGIIVSFLIRRKGLLKKS